MSQLSLRPQKQGHLARTTSLPASSTLTLEVSQQTVIFDITLCEYNSSFCKEPSTFLRFPNP